MFPWNAKNVFKLLNERETWSERASVDGVKLAEARMRLKIIIICYGEYCVALFVVESWKIA